MARIACLALLLLYLPACTNTFKEFDVYGNLKYHVESHYDNIEYKIMPDGSIWLKAGDNISGWQLILPAIVQKAPSVQIGGED